MLQDTSEMLQLAVEELRRLARNGVAPSQEQFNTRRAAGLPTARVLTQRTGVRWGDLLRMAGLRLRNQRPPAQGAPGYPHMSTGDGIPALASSRRVREFYVRQQDGTVRRIVQESVSLR